MGFFSFFLSLCFFFSLQLIAGIKASRRKQTQARTLKKNPEAIRARFCCCCLLRVQFVWVLGGAGGVLGAGCSARKPEEYLKSLLYEDTPRMAAGKKKKKKISDGSLRNNRTNGSCGRLCYIKCHFPVTREASPPPSPLSPFFLSFLPLSSLLSQPKRSPLLSSLLPPPAAQEASCRSRAHAGKGARGAHPRRRRGRTAGGRPWGSPCPLPLPQRRADSPSLPMGATLTVPAAEHEPRSPGGRGAGPPPTRPLICIASPPRPRAAAANGRQQSAAEGAGTRVSH